MRIQHVGTLLIGAVCLYPVLAETAPAADPGNGPVQAELLARLNVRHLAKGSTVFARVTADWQGNGCTLRQGAILEARVESAVPQARGTHGSSLDLSFNKAQCNGAETTDYGLVLAAVAAAPSEWTNITNSAHFPTSFSNPNGNGMPGFGAAGVGDMSTTHLEFTGLRHNFPMRPNLEPGDVIDIKGIKLAVGKGMNRSSVLTAPNRDVALDVYTQFLLVPASVAFRPSSAPLSTTGNESRMIAPAPRPVPAPDNFETCAPPGCAIDLPVTASEFTGDAASPIAIASLGYAPRPHKVIQNFDDEEALAWLGPQHLLVTFNPHSLIKRAGPSAHAGPVRLIRAVLFDAATHNIVRAVDWEVADWRRYLWPLEGNRVLVHVGNELRIYGAGLNLESSFPLHGPLAFVRIAPNGILMAVATLNERHSAELHSQLHASSSEEPEEDVDIQILDKDFKPLAQAATTSNLMPPTLLNEGQVKLLAQPKMRYRLAMSTWENKTVTLARFESMCKPELSSFAPDLLFLVSCSVPGNDTEYRVLRADGRLVLRGKTGPRDVGEEAIGNSQNQTFALKVVHAAREISSGQEFSGLDLESERVRVYRAADGKPVFAVRVDQPPPSHSSYALSPEGSQLAVLSGTQVRFFPVTPEQ